MTHMQNARCAEQKMPVYVNRIALIAVRNFQSTLAIRQKFGARAAKKKSTSKIIELESHDIEGGNGVLSPICWGFLVILEEKHYTQGERTSPNLRQWSDILS